MSKKKILFICGNISPNSSQGVRYKNILPFLANEYTLFVLSYNDFFNGSNVKKTVLNYNNSQNVQIKYKRIFPKIKTELVKVYKRIIRPFIFPDKYKYSITKYKLEIRQLLSSVDISTVIIGMTPFSLYELAQYVKSLNSGIQVIVDLSDPFSLNGANNYAFIYNGKYIKNYEKEKLKYVDDVIVLNPTIKRMYTEIFSKRVHVIEQGVNIERNLVEKSDYNLKLEYSMIYAGGLYHGFREAYELYKALDNIEKPVSLKIFGNIKNSLLVENSSTIQFYGQIDHEKLNQEYLKSDILVFIDNKEGYQVPGKMLELMALQKPILFIYSNDDSPSLFYIKGSDFVVKVKNTKLDIIAGINEIISTDYSNAENVDISEYYWNNLMNKYIEIIND